MGKQKEKMQELSDFEAYVNDTSFKGDHEIFRCSMDTRSFAEVDMNISETKIILSVSHVNGDSEMVFLSEEEAVKFASAILNKASELKC